MKLNWRTGVGDENGEDIKISNSWERRELGGKNSNILLISLRKKTLMFYIPNITQMDMSSFFVCKGMTTLEYLLAVKDINRTKKKKNFMNINEALSILYMI